MRASASPSFWTDTWRLYEDACLVCAGLWTGRTWRNDHRDFQESWAEVEEDRFLDNPVSVRAHGEGIEGRPITDAGGSSRTRTYRQPTKRYFPSRTAIALSVAEDDVTKNVYQDDEGGEREGAVLVHNRQTRTTLALLQTFHMQTRFLLSRLATLLPPQCTVTTASGGLRTNEDEVVVVQLAPRDVLELELSPLSSLDAQFVEWLVEEYGAGAGAGMRVSVSVRCGWWDLLGLVCESAVGCLLCQAHYHHPHPN